MPHRDVEVGDNGDAPYASGPELFGTKSGKIVMRLSGHNVRVIFFDDYWRTHREENIGYETSAEKRVASHSLLITKGAVVHLLDLLEKTGSRFVAPEGASVSTGGLSLSRTALHSTFGQMKSREEPSEELLGRRCRVYSVDDEAWGYRAKFWFWKNIPLKAVVQGTEMVVTELSLGGISASDFTLPEGVTIEADGD